MAKFQIISDFKPTGDQPQAIEKLVKGLNKGLKHQVLLGVTGSGKSIVGNTPVFIRKKGNKISNENIGVIIDEIFKKFSRKIKTVNGSEIIDASTLTPDYQIDALSLNYQNKEVSWKPVRQLTRHSSPRYLYEVETSCGRKLATTADHNFWVYRKNKLVLLKTKDIRSSDFIPLPEMIPGTETNLKAIKISELFPISDLQVDTKQFISRLLKNYSKAEIVKALSPYYIFPSQKFYTIIKGGYSSMSYNTLDGVAKYLRADILEGDLERIVIGKVIQKYHIPNNYPLTNSFLRLLGYYIAEGHSELSSRFFTISSNEAEVILDLTEILKEFKLNYYHRNYDYSVASKLYVHILSYLAGRDSKSKRLPFFWPNLSNSQLAVLLKAYFEGDGGVWSHRGVVAVTASEKLASDLSYALLRFGIWSRVYRSWQKAHNSNHKGSHYWNVTISGRENIEKFIKYIGFISTRKKEALRKVFLRCKKTYKDIIPNGSMLLKKYRQKLGLNTYKLGRISKIDYHSIYFIEKGQNRLQRWILKAIIANTENLLPGDEVLTELKSLLNCHWTTLKSVRKIPSKDKYLYDFSVEDNETFLAGDGGIFVHNTFTMANVIQAVQKPTLIIAQNKTLGAQLAQEFRSLFPENAVEYFVSYYDYYQPEAYLPSSDTYIEKDASINEEIEKLRLSATTSLLTRRDVIVVASVSCIYNLGSPLEYGQAILEIGRGMKATFNQVMKILQKMYYDRNDIDFKRGTYRVRGEVIDIFPSYMDSAYRVQFLGDKVEKVTTLDPLTAQTVDVEEPKVIYPAKHYITPEQRVVPGIKQIELDLGTRLKELRKMGKLVEAQRLEQRTQYDLEMIRQYGYCNGIENYSRYFDGRKPGEPPYTLLNYFPEDFLVIIDESHITLPQIRGMYNGDRSRKETLIEFGFRLPSALDNRPLRFEEFMRRANQAVYTSATPDEYELSLACPGGIAEQLIRPTGLLDPQISVRTTTGQIEDLISEIEQRVNKHERVLVTTLTKRMAEDLADYLKEKGIKVHYLHSDIVTLERSDILQSLRLGEYDVIVGINLLREGLDLPEVSLVAILDADKEGFLRSRTSLIQTMGRAARHVNGQVIMYADTITKSMQAAIDEVDRRRQYQAEYNKKNKITPVGILKPMRERLIEKVEEETGEKVLTVDDIPANERKRLVKNLESQMKQAAELLDFETAAKLRDQIKELNI